jgi:hypothetical protein
MKSIVVVLFLLALVGCSGKYTKPHGGSDNAQLRLSSVPSNNNFIHKAINKSCIIGNGSEQIATLGSKANLIRSLSRNGIPLYNSDISDSHQNEVYVPSGKEFAVQFNGVGITGFSPGVSNSRDGLLYSWCRKILKFTPESNAYYEALYEIVETPEGKETCDVRLFNIAKNSNGKYEKAESKNYEVVHNYCN